MHVKMKELNAGDSAEIIGYDSKDAAYRQKILSMGLTKGTLIKVKKIAPLGDPVEIQVRGFNLSLRKDEAEAVLLRRVD